MNRLVAVLVVVACTQALAESPRPHNVRMHPTKIRHAERIESKTHDLVRAEVEVEVTVPPRWDLRLEDTEEYTHDGYRILVLWGKPRPGTGHPVKKIEKIKIRSVLKSTKGIAFRSDTDRKVVTHRWTRKITERH
jgi:hypothetical protein